MNGGNLIPIVSVFLLCEGQLAAHGTGRTYYYGTHGAVTISCMEEDCALVIVSGVPGGAIIVKTSSKDSYIQIKEIKSGGQVYSASQNLILAKSQIVEIFVKKQHNGLKFNWTAVKLCDDGKCEQRECTVPFFYSFGGGCIVLVNIIAIAYGCMLCNRKRCTLLRQEKAVELAPKVENKSMKNSTLERSVRNFVLAMRRLRNGRTYEVHREHSRDAPRQAEYTPLAERVFTDIASVKRVHNTVPKGIFSKNKRKHKETSDKTCSEGKKNRTKRQIRNAISESDIACIDGTEMSEREINNLKIFNLRKSMSTDNTLNSTRPFKLGPIKTKGNAVREGKGRVEATIDSEAAPQDKDRASDSANMAVSSVNEDDDGYLVPSQKRQEGASDLPSIDVSHLNETRCHLKKKDDVHDVLPHKSSTGTKATEKEQNKDERVKSQ